MALADKHGSGALLVDTYIKDGHDLFHHWTPPRARKFINDAHDCGCVCVLAGSLREDSLRLAASLAPDYVAVRSAVCDGDRSSQILGRLVSSVAMEVRSNAVPFVTTN